MSEITLNDLHKQLNVLKLLPDMNLAVTDNLTNNYYDLNNEFENWQN